VRLYENTAAALRYGIVAGIIVIAIGLMVSSFDTVYEDRILWFGVLILLATPLFGIVVSLISLAAERDWKWVSVASVLLAIIASGVIIAYLV
jgi:Protein of unknown function (DUF1634).